MPLGKYRASPPKDLGSLRDEASELDITDPVLPKLEHTKPREPKISLVSTEELQAPRHVARPSIVNTESGVGRANYRYDRMVSYSPSREYAPYVTMGGKVSSKPKFSNMDARRYQ